MTARNRDRQLHDRLDALEQFAYGGQGAPVLDSIDPVGADIGTDPLELVLAGSGFTPVSQIMWNGAADPTGVWVSATEMRLLIDPRTASGAWTIPVAVETYGAASAALEFQFTDPNAPPESEAAATKSKGKK